MESLSKRLFPEKKENSFKICNDEARASGP
jgi:hypothetical protein